MQPQAQVSDALSSKRSTQLSSNPSHSYNNPHKIFTLPPDNTNGCATPTHGGAAAAYGNYIQKILKRTGIIENVTVFTSIKWHTPSHPIDPSVFYYLELFHPSATTSAAVHGGRNPTLSHRCNRRLIFQLVDELLAEILKPHFNFKPRVSPVTEKNDFPLFDQLCEKIDSFPAADCRVLEDIDSLIDTDLCKYRLNGFFEEEWESIVCEIEGGIMEALLSETAAAAVAVGGRTTEEYRQRLTGVTW
ncbi:hypothetical protein BUALT_Bualt06G0119100 [Buddleja alternifolia]|uniref:DUF4378 domain-containing protein n=1 Tax=Buddleja alternifolia TaxID=168488 RepID=A0AAV6XMF1_9LAMI|nr:hypothetical protein BUALT_Bualt06G0119100 [Buddleja alternifolia]